MVDDRVRFDCDGTSGSCNKPTSIVIVVMKVTDMTIQYCFHHIYVFVSGRVAIGERGDGDVRSRRRKQWSRLSTVTLVIGNLALDDG